jgi:hypothetical protein
MPINPEDERLDSVQSYVDEVRTLLLDKRKPYRYSDSEILTALNTSLAEARRLRADLFVYRHGNHVPYFTAISGETVPIDTQFRLAFVYGIAGHVLERDDEDVQDQRAASFTSQFYSILIGIQRPPIQGGNKGPGSPQA